MNERSWQLAIGSIGVMIGLITAFIYFGGSLRQIDINSIRLTSLEQHGSPAVQTLLNQFGDVKATIARIDAIVTNLPASDAEQRTKIADMRASLDVITQTLVDMERRHLTEVQRLAIVEALLLVCLKPH